MDGFVLDNKHKIGALDEWDLPDNGNEQKKKPQVNAWARPNSKKAGNAIPSTKGSAGAGLQDYQKKPNPYFEEEKKVKPEPRVGKQGSSQQSGSINIENEGVISAILALIKELPHSEVSIIKRDIEKRLGM